MRFSNFWTYRNILLSRPFAEAVRSSRRNVLASIQGRPPASGPYMAELDISYRCNCRCRMCQRWDDPREGELGLDVYLRLADVFRDLGVHQISIAGGEPLIRKDVFSIIRGFSSRGMSVNLCTNGILLEKYADEICRSGATCISVSLDGASEASHDTIRGAPGSYRRIEKGIRSLLGRSRRNRPVIRVRFTICKENQMEIGAFYRKWEKLADDVLFQPAHNCGEAFYTARDDVTFRISPQVISEQLKGTPLHRTGYLQKLIASLSRDGTYPQQPCYAGILMARIDPWGNVFPCLEQHVCMGSVREADFRDIWNSYRFQRERQRHASGHTCRCWYNNTAMIGHFGGLLAMTSADSLWTRLREKGSWF